MLAANRWGALECINAGITTLVDWSHIMNTPAHADAAVEGLKESRIRSVFAYGFGNTSLQDWWFGPDWTGSVLTCDGDDARRIRKQYFNSDDGLVTMALATRGPGFCKPDVVRYDWELAKELGINITVHVAMDRFGYTKMQIAGSATWTCSTRTRRTSTPRTSPTRSGRWRATRAATSRSRRRSRSRWATAGRPAGRRPEYGLPIGLSSDVATTAPSDQFTQMRSIFGSERGRKHQEAWEADLDGNVPSPDLITSRQVLEWATLGGAQVAGHRRPDGLAHAGQEGRHRDHRRLGGERRAGHRPGRRGRLRGRRLERQDRPRRRRDPEADFRLAASLDAPRKGVEASRDYLVSKFGEPEAGLAAREGDRLGPTRPREHFDVAPGCPQRPGVTPRCCDR